MFADSENIDIETVQDDLAITEKEFNLIIKKISAELKLDLILCYVPELYKDINTKIAKILTTKGFHHMYAAKIDPTKTSLLQNDNKELYNIGKMIPFG